MSIIKSGTTNTTAYSVDANTDGDLVFIVSESLTAMSITAAGAVSLPTSSLTITSGATLNGGVVVNEDGADVDFRVEGNGDSHLLFADANENAVGVSTGGNALDDFKFEVVGNKAIGGVRISDTFDANGYEIVTGTTNIITAYNRGTATWLPLRQRANQHEFYCDGVETLRLNSAGALVLKGGDTAANGTGITFPATLDASSNANTLDDYEEGTWTPTIIGTSTNPVYTASVASGNYTKIGKMVYVEFLIIITGVTSQGTGNVNISGLPFTNASGSYMPNFSFIYNDVWDVNMRNGYMTSTWIQPVPNSVTQANTGWSGVTLSTGYFSGSGWYIA